LIQQLLKTIKQEAIKGPLPSFTLPHIIYTILLIGSVGPIGRKRLASQLAIGEGAIRTILNKLKKLNIVKESRNGYQLSAKGTRIFKELTSKITIPMEIYFPTPLEGESKAAIIIHEAADKIKTGIEERDEAIRAGADAALILVMENGEILMPRLSNISREQQKLAEDIITTLKPTNKDVIIITAADNPQTAKYAALASALSLVKQR